jgi:uncharacterized delta-60 repeat protein
MFKNHDQNVIFEPFLARVKLCAYAVKVLQTTSVLGGFMKPVLPLIATIALATLAACTSNPTATTPITTVSTAKSKFVGLLEVSVEGIGDGGRGTATAKFVNPASLRPNLSAKTVTVVPVNNTNALDDIQFASRYVSFLDNDASGTRYVTNQFEITNRSNVAFDNLTLYAVNVPGITLGGTGVAQMFKANGDAITDASKAREFMPTHAMRIGASDLEVNPNAADLQLFSSDEVSNPSTGVKKLAVDAGIIPSGSTVLEYGFVARSKNAPSYSRTIGNRNTATDCTSYECKGTISLAYKFPKVSPRGNNPWAFKLYFVVGNDTESASAQSLEEQENDTIGGLEASNIGSSQIRVLLGSSYFGDAYHAVLSLCNGVRTAVGPDSFLAAPPVVTSGALDLCFGVSGRKRHFGAGFSTGVRSDGKFVVADFAPLNGPDSTGLHLTRYNPDWTLDLVFGNSGVLNVPFSYNIQGVEVSPSPRMVIQPDDKMLIVGKTVYTANSGSSYYLSSLLIRLNADGSPDLGFGSNGVVYSTGVASDAIALQSDGQIVLAGTVQGAYGVLQFQVKRYNGNGTPDLSFGSSGVFYGDSTCYCGVNTLAIQSDGKIVVAGIDGSVGGGGDFYLGRLNSDGTADTGFGSNGTGFVTTPIGTVGTDSYVNAVALQNDGKILAAGRSSSLSEGESVALMRYNNDGTPDAGFAGGALHASVGPGSIAQAMIVQPSGRIAVAGRKPQGAALVLFNSNGGLLSTATTNIYPSFGSDVRDLLVQSDGKFVLVSDNMIARFNL